MAKMNTISALEVIESLLDRGYISEAEVVYDVLLRDYGIRDEPLPEPQDRLIREDGVGPDVLVGPDPAKVAEYEAQQRRFSLMGW